jgi:hypothetical protein
MTEAPPEPIAITPTNSRLTRANHWDHILARWGWQRERHWVKPGIYALGTPTPDSPVFVTANYTLSFDALRTALAGVDCYILVLLTYGINVWCAAGKGTFSTDELVERIAGTRLGEVVRHRRLIVPQLGATGVCAREVRRRSGFTVAFGPVRAADIPAYLAAGKASPAMRLVKFALVDRLVQVPLELVTLFLWFAGAAVVAWLAGGWLLTVALGAAYIAGTVLFPLLLPWLPSRDFSFKGWVLGIIVIVPFAVLAAINTAADPFWRWVQAAGITLTLPTVVAFIALNFTGATTFTSKTGVRHEMRRYIPIMALCFGLGIIALFTVGILWWAGVR